MLIMTLVRGQGVHNNASRRWPARWNKTGGEKHGSQAGGLGPASDVVSHTARVTKSIGRSDEGKAHVNYTGSHVTLHTVFVRGYAQFDTLSLCTLVYTYVCWSHDKKESTAYCTCTSIHTLNSLTCMFRANTVHT